LHARLLHVSDLHLRAHGPLPPLEALRQLAERLEPTLLVATGDLAHRGRRRELDRALDCLRSIERPFLAVPGNHDIPITVARFTRPFALWNRVFGATEPVFHGEGLFVLGLNSVRPRRQQSGALSTEQLDRAKAALEKAGDAFKVVAFHHHVANAPWRARNKLPVSRRDFVLHSLANAGADLVLGGHVHQAAVADRREFEVGGDGTARSIVFATAPGLGRPRPRRRGEAQGVNLYDVELSSLTVTTYAWFGDGFAEVGRRVFTRT
jgi:3',5'-cyclic AMP phosphodiesterase CpdA